MQTTTSQRACKVLVKPTGAKRPTVFRFENQGCTGRAAKWMQKHFPVARALTETKAELLGGGELVIERGCTLAELYPPAEATAPAPQTAPVPTPAAEEPAQERERPAIGAKPKKPRAGKKVAGRKKK